MEAGGSSFIFFIDCPLIPLVSPIASIIPPDALFFPLQKL